VWLLVPQSVAKTYISLFRFGVVVNYNRLEHVIPMKFRSYCDLVWSGDMRATMQATLVNVETLIKWFRRREKPAGMAEICAAGLFDARAAHGAVGYAVRHHVLEPEGEASRRRLYRLTGRPLPSERQDAAPSFDALLAAWGFPPVPVVLAAIETRRIELLI
jgi:hypothetical protein